MKKILNAKQMTVLQPCHIYRRIEWWFSWSNLLETSRENMYTKFVKCLLELGLGTETLVLGCRNSCLYFAFSSTFIDSYMLIFIFFETFGDVLHTIIYMYISCNKSVWNRHRYNRKLRTDLQSCFFSILLISASSFTFAIDLNKFPTT